MQQSILDRLSRITKEEHEILGGRKTIDRSIYMDGSRDVVSGEKLLERGRLISIRPHTRFIAFPEHTHDYVEMVYMCAGETRHTVNGSPITLRRGELLMLGRNARQSIEPAGEGDIAVGAVRAFQAGVIDVPFAPSRFNAGKIMPARDNDGAVRMLNIAGLPFTDDLKAFHQEKIAQRAKAEKRAVSFQMVIDDIYAISKGRLVGRPRG